MPSQGFNFTGLAFPHNNYLPAKFFQVLFWQRITLNISLKFTRPEICTAFRGIGKRAVFMPVPITSMYENYCPIFRQNNIRVSWEISSMKSETESWFVQERADRKFRGCILRANSRHIPTAMFFRDSIHKIKRSRNFSSDQKPIQRFDTPTEAGQHCQPEHTGMSLVHRKNNCQEKSEAGQPPGLSYSCTGSGLDGWNNAHLLKYDLSRWLMAVPRPEHEIDRRSGQIEVMILCSCV